MLQDLLLLLAVSLLESCQRLSHRLPLPLAQLLRDSTTQVVKHWTGHLFVTFTSANILEATWSTSLC